MTPPLVVLTDFFDVSNHALSYAAGLAVPLDAHLVLLHVRHDALLAPETCDSQHPARSERQTAQALLQQLAADQPVPTEVDISEEFLPGAVTEAVRQLHPLLLVLGRPGSATAPAEIVSSTVQALLRYAPCPLLVVPTVGWKSLPPKRLLLAVDGQPFRIGAHQDVLRQLLLATQSTLDVVHVSGQQPQPSRAALLDTVRANNLVDHVADSCLHEVVQATAMGGVLQEAARQQADLLVIVARHHSLLGSLFHRSVTAQLIQESLIPVLVLPAED